MTPFDKVERAASMANLSVRSYSGRSMFGKQCIGVDLESYSDLWLLAQAAEHYDFTIPPSIDSMGMGLIAYWTGIAWEGKPVE